MKEGYIPKEQRKKILLLCDDIRLPSGVGNVGKDLIIHTSHRYNWVNLGAAMDHPEKGKKFDLSEDTSKVTGVPDPSVFVYPNTGYGDANLLRNLLEVEKPDAIFLITDPRYFSWLFQIENEIRKQIPIVYLNIWDNYPAPAYNRSFYESCDALLGISKQTVNINKLVLGEKGEAKIIDYVPHGINTKNFFPITEDYDKYDEYLDFQKQVFGGEKPYFTLFFNSRNIRRKQIPDTLLAWKYFLESIPEESRDKCRFILHTEISSDHGTDLGAVKDYLFGKDEKSIIFSTSKLPVEKLNYLYNMADAQILLSSNEGWGLALTEALVTATPILANVTGGMQDQMRFKTQKGDWVEFDENVPSNNRGTFKEKGSWAFPVFPSSLSLQGSPQTPYIWDDRCDPKEAAVQLRKMFLIGPEDLKKRGQEGYKWATGDEAGFTADKMGERIIKNLDNLFDTWSPRPTFELIDTDETPEKVLTHNLIY